MRTGRRWNAGGRGRPAGAPSAPGTQVSLPAEDPCWERLLPAEYRAWQAALPVAFLPLGTVEWHGEHNALGLDALKAHALCVRAARRAGGGIVHPPLYGGMGGLDRPATVVIEGEYTWENHLLRPWLERLCSEMHRQGFRAIIILTGHYGHNQQLVVRETAARMSERLRIPVWGIAEYWLAQDAGYLGDHAGIGETSLLWHLEPGLVRIERLDGDAEYGADGAIAQGAAPERGALYAGLIVERLATVARRMPEWGADELDGFIKAERALVAAQVRGWRENSPWHAWRRMFSGEETSYGELIAGERFAAIETLASRLL